MPGPPHVRARSPPPRREGPRRSDRWRAAAPEHPPTHARDTDSSSHRESTMGRDAPGPAIRRILRLRRANTHASSLSDCGDDSERRYRPCCFALRGWTVRQRLATPGFRVSLACWPDFRACWSPTWSSVANSLSSPVTSPWKPPRRSSRESWRRPMPIRLAAPRRLRPTPPAMRRAASHWLAGVLAWFAVGCPACNQIALSHWATPERSLWFAPVQPSSRHRLSWRHQEHNWCAFAGRSRARLRQRWRHEHRRHELPWLAEAETGRRVDDL